MRRLVVTAIALICGCGGDGPERLTTPTPSIDAAFVGRWELRRVNGDTLPCVVSQSVTTKTVMESGYFSTASAGTFVRQLNSSTTTPTVISLHLDADGGQFTVEGNVLTLHFTRTGATASATVSHDTLKVVEGSLTLLLTR